MQFMKKNFLSVLILAGYNARTYSQCCPYVGPIELYPSSPYVSDSVYLNTSVTTPNSGSYLGYEVIVEGTTIRVKACYFSGIITMPEFYSEIINLGVHEAGTYNVVFVAYQSDSDESCNRLDSNEVTGSFTVTENLALQQETKPAFQVYPNPSNSGLIYITTTKNEAFTYQLSNTLGQIVLTGTNNLSNEIKVEGLKGQYYLSVITEEGTSTKEVIIQ